MNLYVLRTEEDLESLKSYLHNNKEAAKGQIALDFETNGLNVFNDLIIGFSVALFEDEGFYFVLREWDGEQLKEVNPSLTKKCYELIAELKDWKIIGHNLLFDVLMFSSNSGFDLTESIYLDTQLLKHTVDSNRPHALKDCIRKYFGDTWTQEQADLKEAVLSQKGKWNKENKEMYKAPSDILGKYGAADVCLTLKLMNYLLPILGERGLTSFFFNELVMPLYKNCTIPMKLLGFKIDLEYFNKLKLDLDSEISNIEEGLYAEIQDLVQDIINAQLDQEVKPVNKNKALILALLKDSALEIPTNPKTGDFSLAKPVLDKWKLRVLKTANETQIKVIWFLTGECNKLDESMLKKCQLQVYQDKTGNTSPFNIRSNEQLPLLLEKLGIKIQTKTDSGKMELTEDVLESIAIQRMIEDGIPESEAKKLHEQVLECDILDFKADWFSRFIRYKKLQKLLGTYVDGILRVQLNGVIHGDMKQHGTQTGRYASSEPNLQNLPAHSKLGAMIKRGFIA
jgi:DNA polymerase I-like protein with 3'-5' exonuclease and polymerase domains